MSQWLHYIIKISQINMHIIKILRFAKYMNTTNIIFSTVSYLVLQNTPELKTDIF